MNIYKVCFEYGSPNLTKVSVIRETPKNYIVSREAEHLIGWQYIPSRLPKDNEAFFTKQEALSFLLQEAENYATSCADNLEKSLHEVSRLRKIIEKEPQ